jgi:hypothetical protein
MLVERVTPTDSLCSPWSCFEAKAQTLQYQHNATRTTKYIYSFYYTGFLPLSPCRRENATERRSERMLATPYAQRSRIGAPAPHYLPQTPVPTPTRSMHQHPVPRPQHHTTVCAVCLAIYMCYDIIIQTPSYLWVVHALKLFQRNADPGRPVEPTDRPRGTPCAPAAHGGTAGAPESGSRDAGAALGRYALAG